MSAKIRMPQNPPHPGGILLREFLEPLGLSQSEFAKHLGLPFQRVNAIVNGRRAISPESALFFAKALGTTPQFWLSMQDAYDLVHAKVDTAKIKPLIKLSA